MGRAARWLRALFGGKKPSKEKKTWGSFVKSFREKESKRQEAAPYENNNKNNNNSDVYDAEEQNKRAIAVAAATAAVAEAAVAAAQAAAAVVRLTSSGRVVVANSCDRKAEIAAVRIQSAFRAYLARRALRALKGLVKLQAIVRGNIVRKQAAETLRCMHALVRVQARARACRALLSDRDRFKSSSRNHRGLITPEKSERSVQSNSQKSDRSSSPFKRNASKQASSNEATSGLRWLDQWMEERYYDTANSGTIAISSQFDDEKNAKILEIDTGKQNYNSKGKPSYLVQHPSDVPSPRSADMQRTPSPLSFPVVNACDFGESPHFFSATSSRRGHFTPTKSECSRSLFSGYSDYPNYMANTESSKAKVRSQSAPRHRPDYVKSSSLRRFSGGGGGGGGGGLGQQSRSSSCKAYPGSGKLDRLGMPVRN